MVILVPMLGISFEIALKILEGLAYVSSLGVLFIAFKGLQQINIAKKNVIFSSRRDALRVTNELISNFFNLYLPEKEKVRYSQNEKDLLASLVLNSDKTFNIEEIKKNKRLEYDFNNELGIKSYYNDITGQTMRLRNYYNMLESFAMAFTNGLGDEPVAFKAVARPFCNTVSTNETVLEFFHSQGYYPNLMTLYHLWQKKLNIEKIRANFAEIEASKSEVEDRFAELNRLMKEVDDIESNNIKSLGTDI